MMSSFRRCLSNPVTIARNAPFGAGVPATTTTTAKTTIRYSSSSVNKQSSSIFATLFFHKQHQAIVVSTRRYSNTNNCISNRGTILSSKQKQRIIIKRLSGTTAVNNSHCSELICSKKLSMTRYHIQRYHTAASVKADAGTLIAEDSGRVIGTIVPPTKEQFKLIFLRSAIPMIGFGFMDQTIMLQAGHLIDCTLGVTLGLSTLTAAAFGQICSDASGVLFGGTLESLASSAGLPKAGLLPLQRSLPAVKRMKLAGSFFGVIVGCCLGLVNLLFIDTSRSESLKLEASFTDDIGQVFEFEIEASNSHEHNPNMTMLKVTGPDVDGLLASMTAALSVRGCSLVELHAGKRLKSPSTTTDNNDNNNFDMIEDIFYVVKRDTLTKFDDDELNDLARGLLDSTRTPMNVNTVKAAMHELENTNKYLIARVQKLEELVYEKQIKIVASSSSNTTPE